MHIPHRIVTGRKLSSARCHFFRLLHRAWHLLIERTVLLPAGGNLTRLAEQDRIDFLAQARNRALEPLWLNATAAATSDHLAPMLKKVNHRQFPMDCNKL